MPPTKPQQDVIAYREFVDLKFSYISEKLDKIEQAITNTKELERRIIAVEYVVNILKWAFGIVTVVVLGLLGKALETWLF